MHRTPVTGVVVISQCIEINGWEGCEPAAQAAVACCCYAPGELLQGMLMCVKGCGEAYEVGVDRGEKPTFRADDRGECSMLCCTTCTWGVLQWDCMGYVFVHSCAWKHVCNWEAQASAT